MSMGKYIHSGALCVETKNDTAKLASLQTQCSLNTEKQANEQANTESGVIAGSFFFSRQKGSSITRGLAFCHFSNELFETYTCNTETNK